MKFQSEILTSLQSEQCFIFQENKTRMPLQDSAKIFSMVSLNHRLMTINMDQPWHGQQQLQDQNQIDLLPLHQHSRVSACRGRMYCSLPHTSHHVWFHSEEWSQLLKVTKCYRKIASIKLFKKKTTKHTQLTKEYWSGKRIQQPYYLSWL